MAASYEFKSDSGTKTGSSERTIHPTSVRRMDLAFHSCPASQTPLHPISTYPTKFAVNRRRTWLFEYHRNMPKFYHVKNEYHVYYILRNLQSFLLPSLLYVLPSSRHERFISPIQPTTSRLVVIVHQSRHIRPRTRITLASIPHRQSRTAQARRRVPSRR